MINKSLTSLQKGGYKMIMKSRKLIVPLIAIMISAVALAGVAYAAYNSSVQDDGGNNDSDYAALVFTTSEGTEITSGTLASATGLTLTTTTVISTPNVTIGTDGNLEILVYFKLTSDKTTANYTVADDFKLLNSVGTEVTSLTIDASGVNADHKTVNFASSVVYRNQADTENAPATLVKDTVYLAKITITVTADVQFDNATAIADVTAVNTAINGLHYSLELTSTSA